MGFFDRFKHTKEPEEVLHQYFSTLSGYSPVFSSFDGGVFEAKLTRAAINAVATQFSKLKPEVLCDNSQKRGWIERIIRKPNEFHLSSQFFYRVATVLQCETTAFLIPVLDSLAVTRGLICSPPTSVETLLDNNGEFWYQFSFANGESIVIESWRIGIMRQFQYKNDLYGDGNAPIQSTLELSHAQGEALRNRIAESADIKWIGRIAQQIAPNDLEKKRDTFSAENLSKDNKSGLLLYDATFSDIEQVEYKGWSIDAEQMEQIENSVYNYFGVTQDILQNSFTEDTWGAFYEGKIEPLAIQASEVLTDMFFTQTDQAKGEHIMFTSNRLAYASNASKINATQTLVDRGMLTLNQALTDIWNLPPVGAEGDIRVIRGEYINIDKLPSHEVGKAKDYLGAKDVSSEK